MNKDNQKLDDIDILLYNYFKENQQVPEMISNGISEALYIDTHIDFKLLIKRIIISLISLLTIASSVVFAEEIQNFIKTFFHASKGVDTAVSNNYIYNNPETSFIESENTKFRINSIVMDDFNLNIELVANFDDGINVSNTDKISIPDMVISDESGNIIFFGTKDALDNYYSKINKQYDYNQIYSNTLTLSPVTTLHDSGGNVGAITCNLVSHLHNFPKSKQIKLYFNTIILENNEQIRTISGNWDLVTSVPSEFYNRETKIYQLKECNDSRIKKESITAFLSKTGLTFNMEMNWSEFKEYSIDEKQKSITSTILIKNEYIINDNGEIFDTAKSSDSDGGYGQKPDGTLIYWQTFNITSFDATDELKVVLPINDGSEITITLINNT